MSLRFFSSLKKWPLALQEALSQACKTELSGNIRRISFKLGKPGRGILPVSVDIDGHRALFVEVSDLYPVLGNLRDWMERCLSFDRNGRFQPEILTMNLVDSVYSIVMIHVGWEDVERDSRAVSVFIVIREGHRHPLLCEFCYTVETLCSMYHAILTCLERYRRSFDNPDCWYTVKRFDRLDSSSTTDRLLRMFRSRDLEMKSAIIYQNGRH